MILSVNFCFVLANIETPCDQNSKYVCASERFRHRFGKIVDTAASTYGGGREGGKENKLGTSVVVRRSSFPSVLHVRARVYFSW